MLISKIQKKIYMISGKEGVLEVVEELPTDKECIEATTLSNIQSTRLLARLEASRTEFETGKGNGIEDFMKFVSSLITLHNTTINVSMLPFNVLTAVASKLIEESLVTSEELGFLG